MAVGIHLGIGNWDNKAFELFQAYQKFCSLAQEMAGYLDPLTDQQVADRTGYTLDDVQVLKTGVSVAEALRKVSTGDNTDILLTMAGQVSVFVGKFGGA